MRTYQVSPYFIIIITILMNSGCCPNYPHTINANGNNLSGRLNLVDVRQATSYTCGVACVQAILNYYGIDKRQDVLAEEFGTTEENGTSPSRIIAGLERYGLVATLKEYTTMEDLQTNLQNGIPTMAAIQAWLETYPASDWSTNWEDGHWVIVVGLDDQNVYLEDPSLLGTCGWLTREEFLDRWHDYTGEAPCCGDDDRPLMRLSISVKGKPIEYPAYTHIE